MSERALDRAPIEIWRNILERTFLDDRILNTTCPDLVFYSFFDHLLPQLGSPIAALKQQANILRLVCRSWKAIVDTSISFILSTRQLVKARKKGLAPVSNKDKSMGRLQRIALLDCVVPTEVSRPKKAQYWWQLDSRTDQQLLQERVGKLVQAFEAIVPYLSTVKIAMIQCYAEPATLSKLLQTLQGSCKQLDMLHLDFGHCVKTNKTNPLLTPPTFSLQLDSFCQSFQFMRSLRLEINYATKLSLRNLVHPRLEEFSIVLRQDDSRKAEISYFFDTWELPRLKHLSLQRLSATVFHDVVDYLVRSQLVKQLQALILTPHPVYVAFRPTITTDFSMPSYFWTNLDHLVELTLDVSHLNLLTSTSDTEARMFPALRRVIHEGKLNPFLIVNLDWFLQRGKNLREVQIRRWEWNKSPPPPKGELDCLKELEELMLVRRIGLFDRSGRTRSGYWRLLGPNYDSVATSYGVVERHEKYLDSDDDY